MNDRGVIERGWVFRLETTDAQNHLLQAQDDARRGIWNMLHQWYVMCSENGRWPSLKDMDHAVRQGRKDIDWMAVLPAQAAQAIIKEYHRAWRACYRSKGKVGAPHFKAKSRTPVSIDVPQARDLGITKLTDRYSTIKVPLIGPVTFRLHRRIPGRAIITGAKITYLDGHWWISLRMKLRRPRPLPADRPVVGCDRGITVPLASSDGTMDTHGPWLSPAESHRKHLLERRGARQREQRFKRLGRKSRPGANEVKTYTAIAVLTGTERRRRNDWQHKLTRRLATDYSKVAFEDLKVKNMMASAAGTIEAPGTNVAQKKGLNRVIGQEGWSMVAQKVTYKMDETGGTYQQVPAAGTSQECHRCESKAPGQRKSQALFQCLNPACGWTGNADLNASLNIQYRAFGRPTATPAVGEGTCITLTPSDGLPDAALPHTTRVTAQNTGTVTEGAPLGAPLTRENTLTTDLAA